MYPLTVVVFVIFVILWTFKSVFATIHNDHNYLHLRSSRGSELANRIYDCEFALTKCKVMSKCTRLLNDYRVACLWEEQSVNPVTKSDHGFDCPVNCQLAIQQLDNNQAGHEYLQCDCVNNKFCRKLQLKSFHCHPKRISKVKQSLTSDATNLQSFAISIFIIYQFIHFASNLYIF